MSNVSANEVPYIHVEMRYSDFWDASMYFKGSYGRRMDNLENGNAVYEILFYDNAPDELLTLDFSSIPFYISSIILSITGNVYGRVVDLNCSDLSCMTKFDVDNIILLNGKNVFTNCSELVEISPMNISYVTDMSSMFKGCSLLETIPQLDTSNVVNMNNAFSFCHSLVETPVLDTHNVKTMACMFYSCKNLKKVYFYDVINVVDMFGMFMRCPSLTEIPDFNSINVKNMCKMFYACRSLTKAPDLSLDSVFDMSWMYAYCDSLMQEPKLKSSANTYRAYSPKPITIPDVIIKQIEEQKEDKFKEILGKIIE